MIKETDKPLSKWTKEKKKTLITSTEMKEVKLL